jgi:dTDP-4-dehydrorhamnose 3,5-epimerase-like enzyme
MASFACGIVTVIPDRRVGEKIRGTRVPILGEAAFTLALAASADDRGSLYPVEFSELPFFPKRTFTVAKVPARTIRGGHSHKLTSQFLVCVSGAIKVDLRYDGSAATITLETPEHGLFIRCGVWARQTYLTEGSQLLVFASRAYDPDDYVHTEEPV